MALNAGEFVDYYKLLDLQPNASSTQIRNAFIHKAKQNHPDVGGSTESMRHINAAYKTLTSYSHKAAYDLLHSFHTGKKKLITRRQDPKQQIKLVLMIFQTNILIGLSMLFMLNTAATIKLN